MFLCVLILDQLFYNCCLSYSLCSRISTINDFHIAFNRVLLYSFIDLQERKLRNYEKFPCI